jgi:hypothetical protein
MNGVTEIEVFLLRVKVMGRETARFFLGTILTPSRSKCSH